MRRPLRWLIAMVGAALAFAVLPAAALATSQPSIEWTNAWNLTPTDATVGAGINPEGLSSFGAYYEFQVAANTSEYLSEIACPPRAKLKGTDGCGPGPEVEGALPIGQVPNGMKGETVTLDLAKAGMTLKPGTTYHYRVLAVKALETEDTIQWEPPVVVASDQTFTTPLASTPTVESEAASHVTEHHATLEAKIDSEDLPEGAYYQFQVVKSASEYLPELTCPEPLLPPYGDNADCGSPDSSPHTPGALPLGYIAKGPEGQSVSLSLAAAGVTLQPGTTYHYRVLAAKRVQSEDGVDWQGPFVAGPDRTFTTLPAGKAPMIESVSISHLTPTDATLEAKINTEDLETEYAFQMWSSPCSKKGAGCEVILDVPLPTGGSLYGSSEPQTVSLDLNSVGVTLREGEYGFSVTANNEEGHTSAFGGVFEAPPGVIDPLGPTVTPGPTGSTPGASSDGSQSAGSETSAPTMLGTSIALGTSGKTDAGSRVGSPRPSTASTTSASTTAKSPPSTRRRAKSTSASVGLRPT